MSSGEEAAEGLGASISRTAHPLFDGAAFVGRFDRPLGELPTTDAIAAGLTAPPSVDDGVRETVRALLRSGGFKPTGRSKPASEYLLKAAAEGGLRAINVAVDAGNVVSLHSGLPISVIDLDRTEGRLRIDVAQAGERYVFNASGQEIELAGLLVLRDDAGPCANAVKDAQRTKTGPETRRVLTIVWGSRALPGLTERTAARCRTLFAEAGAKIDDVVWTDGGAEA